MSELVKIRIPEHKGDITLGQYQKYLKLLEKEYLEDYEFTKRKISIFLNIGYNKLDKINISDFNELLSDVDNALNTQHEFKDRFFIRGVEFGFIPNFDKITSKEFVDTGLYPPNEKDKLHKLMAILFRPVSNIDVFGNYKIREYEGTEDYSELMKHMPLSIVDGALVFFCNLAKELRKSIRRSTAQEILKVKKQ